MNIQELATAAEENVNVKVILMNNATLGLVFQQQTLFYEKHILVEVQGHAEFHQSRRGVRLAGL